MVVYQRDCEVVATVLVPVGILLEEAVAEDQQEYEEDFTPRLRWQAEAWRRPGWRGAVLRFRRAGRLRLGECGHGRACLLRAASRNRAEWEVAIGPEQHRADEGPAYQARHPR